MTKKSETDQLIDELFEAENEIDYLEHTHIPAILQKLNEHKCPVDELLDSRYVNDYRDIITNRKKS